ncbi:MAG: enoyl-CoA hydratase-related protein [Candidatus Bathyarchaeia archaeon]|jgi:enoyl-CoA hydratase/carnithine racemase
MDYTKIKVTKIERVGVITLDDPPRNGFSKRMIYEILDVLDQFEKDDEIRAVMLKSTGKDFSVGAGVDDIKKDLAGENEVKASFSELGGRIVERIDGYLKPTLVAARGTCLGGSTAVFSSFDIRIVGENFNIHDGDIYYGMVGSWGMSSLRLPIWIGRNKVMDYMFLNEGFNGRQAYELGLVSKVVPDDQVDEIGLTIAKKMSTAAPIAVRYYKECVRNAIYINLAEARVKEAEVARIVNATEDARLGLAAVIRGESIVFKGR